MALYQVDFIVGDTLPGMMVLEAPDEAVAQDEVANWVADFYRTEDTVPVVRIEGVKVVGESVRIAD